MSLSKPYKRLYRPSVSHGWSDDILDRYIDDVRNIADGESSSLMTAARLIIQDFEDLFVFIEPVDAHKTVYSHRIYELFLRTCTEIEANCKGILKANGYTKSGDFNMSDYKKLDPATHLSSYSVTYSKWSPTYVCQPFAPWASGGSLKWYQDYNAAKHDRYINFNCANMENLLQAISALLCLLYVQFGDRVCGLASHGIYAICIDTPEVSISHFTLTPHTWSATDIYDFNWDTLKSQPDAFSEYRFT